MQSRSKTQLTAEIEALRAELARLERQAGTGRTEAGPAGHELRTLGAIVNAVYGLKSMLAEDTRVRKYVEILEREARVATRIVTDLDAPGTASSGPGRNDDPAPVRSADGRPIGRPSVRP